ncbi:nuclear transport factor 2 family protein [Xanthomonas campestris pv. carissae]|nr:nuclear transport factor 2 family protein [Xanthomonas campestris pv. carissae]
MSEDALLVQLRTLELRLRDPSLRAGVQVLETLLDPAFVEFGTSGRRDMRSEVIAALRTRCCCRLPGRRRRMGVAGAGSGAVALSVDGSSSGG